MTHKGHVAGFSAFAIFSILVTGLIWNTLQNTVAEGSARDFTAEFADVSGLHVNDHVRIAGVRVGRVERIELDGVHAKVTFSVANDQPVYATTRVAVRYQNLIGQRFLSLETPQRPPGGDLQPERQEISTDRTDDSLDLSRLLNGFEPVFQLLSPDDINQLADSLIKAFEGQGPALDAALSQIVELSGTFAERDEIFGSIVDNLTPVLETMADAGGSYEALLEQADRLVRGLNDQREAIGGAVDGLSVLVSSVNGLLTDARDPLKSSIVALNEVLGVYGPQAQVLRKTLTRLPGFLDSLGRVAMEGSWLSVYPCHLDGSIEGLIPAGVASQFLGHQHTEVCR